jgi:FMN reductase
MPDVIAIGGSPSLYSKSSALLGYTRHFLETQGLSTELIEVRELPAEALLLAQVDNPVIQSRLRLVAQASAVIVATPVYKAAYSGILKAFLDLLPQNALAHKIVLPLATGGSAAHTLAIDYALKPVLAALGARQFLNGVYFTDSQIQTNANFQDFQLQAEAEERLHSSLQELVERLPLAVK